MKAQTPDDLEKEVKRLIAQGWEPLGGPLVMDNAWAHAGWAWVQAMIRRM